MRLSFCLALLAGAAIGGSSNVRLFAADSAEKKLTGHDLFVRKWVMHDQRSPSGDGLGPMHNATSCAACHHLKGAGGAGSRDHNVDLLSVAPPAGDVNRGVFTNHLIQLHPGFGGGGFIRANLVLHRYGPEADYFDFRARLLGVEEPRPDDTFAHRAVTAASLAKRRAKRPSPIEKLPHGDVTLLRTERNTPALWGAGLIDSIPDAVLAELAKTQAAEHPQLSGRVPRSADGQVGRFGWRGQTSTLRQFILAACANELGLQTADHAQAANPLALHYKPAAVDLSPADVDLLVAFIANLPQPAQREPRSPHDRELLRQGERAFNQAGCSACHLRAVGRVEGVFSDLLLHDLGPQLEDPVEALPEPRSVAVGGPVIGYSGSGTLFRDEEIHAPELAREWRTPPLWGVADSPPYLHDGRAETLAEAILLHGGEAADSVSRFRELTGEQRTAFYFFLHSLIAPPPHLTPTEPSLPFAGGS